MTKTTTNARIRGPVGVRIAAAVAVGVAATLVWASTGQPYFWPRWVWFGVATILAADVLLRRAMRVPAGRRRWLALDGAVCALLALLDMAVWTLSGGGLFWPIWSVLALSTVFGTHAFILSRQPDPRESRLTERVDTLTRSRRDAVDDQATELKRVERDLHDGAQARIVSLALNLGMAEELIRSDPDAAAKLLTDARSTAVTALDDLRTVMHSIHPTVLADRGLGDGIRSLALDLAVPVTVQGEPPARLPAAIEAAAYFAVAECLTNIVKHSHATAAHVTFTDDTGRLRIDVGDNGAGGADPNRGTGLHGVIRRLHAIDGQLLVRSPAGGPTLVTLTIPLPE